MKPCPSCTRHVRITETECPFCRATLSCSSSSAIAFVLVLGSLGIVGCGADPMTANDSSSGADTSMSSTDSTMSASSTNATTTTTTSATSTTDDSTTSIDTSTSSSSSTDDPGDQEGAFYGAPGDVGVDNECDLWAQDCPKDEKCAPWSPVVGWEGRCVPIDPDPVPAGEPCTVVGEGSEFLDDCEAGAWCYAVDAQTSTGVCIALCTGTPRAPMCAEGTSCTEHDPDGVVALCLPLCGLDEPDCALELTCTEGAALDGADVCTL